MLPAALNLQRDCKYQRREEFERRRRADVESAAVALSKMSTGVAIEGAWCDSTAEEQYLRER